MQDRPTAAELLDALASFMRDRAEHARDRWERFQFLVAANSLAILRREWELEEDACVAEWSRLDRLLGPEPLPRRQQELARRLRERNEELCRRIREGAFDERGVAELEAHLLATTLDKVRIASPEAARDIEPR